MAAFKLSLLTPKGTIVKNLECTEVTVPTVRGEISLLPEHTHILTELGTGILSLKTTMGSRHFSVTAGICRVMKGEISIFSFASEEATVVDIERAKSAKAKAMSRLGGQESLTDVDLIKFRRKLERAETRIRLANLK